MLSRKATALRAGVRPACRAMLGIPTEPLRSGSGARRSVNAAIAGGVEALKTVSAENLSAQEIGRLLARPRIDFSSILKTVRASGSAVAGPRGQQRPVRRAAQRAVAAVRNAPPAARRSLRAAVPPAARCLQQRAQGLRRRTGLHHKVHAFIDAGPSLCSSSSSSSERSSRRAGAEPRASRAAASCPPPAAHTTRAHNACRRFSKLHQVEPIVSEVREQGDAAVKRYTSKFDRVELDAVCVRIEVRGAVVSSACLLFQVVLCASCW